MTIVEAKRKGSGCSKWLSITWLSYNRTSDGSFWTYNAPFSYNYWSTTIFISSTKRQSAGTLSPWFTWIKSPTTSSETFTLKGVPDYPLITRTVSLLISSFSFKNYFSLT